MKIWIMSDLHLESTLGWDLPAAGARPDFDVMVVAGDLVPRTERGVRWLAQRVTDRPVVVVRGNHELYGQDIDRDLEKALAAAAGTNVHVLENRSVTIGKVTFTGATMWTDFELFGAAETDRASTTAGEVMNDYRRIRTNHYLQRLRPAETARRHRESREFIAAQLREPGRHVVVTHHAPHPDCIPHGAESDLVTAAYVSDLTPLIEMGGPELWIFGHTHESKDFKVGGTRIVSNAKGCGPWREDEPHAENADFDPFFIIEI